MHARNPSGVNRPRSARQAAETALGVAQGEDVAEGGRVGLSRDAANFTGLVLG